MTMALSVMIKDRVEVAYQNALARVHLGAI